MKKIFIFMFLYSLCFSAERFSYKNIPDFKTNETIVYKGISSKKQYGVIIRYQTSVTKDGFWKIEEDYIKGSIVKVKNVFELKESDMSNVRKSHVVALIDLKDMRTVATTSTSYYSFGSVKDTFDIRGGVNYKDKDGEISVFSMYGIEQIARSYPFESAKKMLVKVPMMPSDTKIKIYVQNNGIKSIKVDSKTYSVYELELKIDGTPIAIFFPKILAYVEKDGSRRMIKYNSISGAFDSIDFYMTEYSDGKED